jgi:hypothetical protein
MNWTPTNVFRWKSIPVYTYHEAGIMIHNGNKQIVFQQKFTREVWHEETEGFCMGLQIREVEEKWVDVPVEEM